MYIEESHPQCQSDTTGAFSGKIINKSDWCLHSTGQELGKAAVTGSNQIDLFTRTGMGECPNMLYSAIFPNQLTYLNIIQPLGISRSMIHLQCFCPFIHYCDMHQPLHKP